MVVILCIISIEVFYVGVKLRKETVSTFSGKLSEV